MRKLLVWGLTLCLSLLASFGAAQSALAQADDPALKQSVGAVEVYTVDDFGTEHFETQGTVFAIDLKGDLLTARHVVAPTADDYNLEQKAVPPGPDPVRKYLVWFGSSSQKFNAQLGDCGDKKVDICLLTIDRIDVQRAFITKPFALDCATPVEGDGVTSYGQPPGDLRLNTVHGQITSDYDSNLGKFQSDVQITAGMSGGPVTHNGQAYGLHMGAYANVVTLIQPLYRFRSIFEDSKLDCPHPSDTPTADTGPGDSSDKAVRLSLLLLEAVGGIEQMITLEANACPGGSHGIDADNYGAFVVKVSNVANRLNDLRVELAAHGADNAAQDAAAIADLSQQLNELVSMEHESCSGGERGQDPANFGTLLALASQIQGSLGKAGELLRS